MAIGLLATLREKDKKGLFTSNDSFVNYSTGFLPLDYANGFNLETLNDSNEPYMMPVTGVIGGTFITIIGFSGCGKTTLADQMAWNIINDRSIKHYYMQKAYKESKSKENFMKWVHSKTKEYIERGESFEASLTGDEFIMHIDSEHTALKPRMLQITGADASDQRMILNGENVSIEDTLETIDKICAGKAEMGKEAMYMVNSAATGFKDQWVYIPTVIIIDSLYTFNSKARKENELDGSMSAGREVKEIAQFYTKCLNNMKKYNITIICINHIKSKVTVNQYQPGPSQLMLIKPDEAMPRGLAPIFLAQNCFRLSSNKTSMYKKDEMGFEGMCVMCQIAKSKTSFIGVSIPLSFNKDFGFDPIMTLYEFANSMGIVQGRNPYLFITGAEAYKFNRRDFRRRFINESDFRINVMASIQPYLDNLLGSKEIRDKDKYTSVESLSYTEEEVQNIIEEAV